ncbi:MAG: DUF503 domain-containing protein [Spirochaetaceae bacterium]|nr:MAG: DUF503 domain-containing protein [Spirochaetaceae bacterium]
MAVSMIQIVIELPDVTSIKEKRVTMVSLRDRIIRKFKISVAEVDLQDSLMFGQIGAAVVSNNRRYGEKVMNKVLSFVEDQVPGRLHDVQIHTEYF